PASWQRLVRPRSGSRFGVSSWFRANVRLGESVDRLVLFLFQIALHVRSLSHRLHVGVKNFVIGAHPLALVLIGPRGIDLFFRRDYFRVQARASLELTPFEVQSLFLDGGA